jgi:hypothetical protein
MGCPKFESPADGQRAFQCSGRIAVGERAPDLSTKESAPHCSQLNVLWGQNLSRHWNTLRDSSEYGFVGPPRKDISVARLT